MADIKTDEKYMAIALDLAEKGRGTTSPNPMVGAVVVKDGKVVGKGWHKKAGTPHGEAIALEKAGKLAVGGTLYVNLEPCCHRDKLTAPCTDAVISSKVSRVVVAMVDPNPKVAGRGIEKLREAGIEVVTGVLGERAMRLNEVFTKYITTGYPFVTLKVAQTLDGKIATASGESKWITGPEARKTGHRLRSQSDAIMIGVGTVLKDDPSLTTRLEDMPETRDPHRIILDSHLRLPLDAKVLNLVSKSKTFIATTIAASTGKMKSIKAKKAEILIIDADENGRVNIPALMEELARLGMTNILLEGGARVNSAVLRAGMVDKAMFFIAPKILGGDDARGSIGGGSPDSLDKAVMLTCVHHTTVGQDILVEGYIASGNAAVAGKTVDYTPAVSCPVKRKRRKKPKKESGGAE